MKDELSTVLDHLQKRVEKNTDRGQAGIESELATYGLTLDEFDELVAELLTGAVISGTVLDPHALLASVLITGMTLGRELLPEWTEAA